jgi:hypothetical protein
MIHLQALSVRKWVLLFKGGHDTRYQELGHEEVVQETKPFF